MLLSEGRGHVCAVAHVWRAESKLWDQFSSSVTWLLGTELQHLLSHLIGTHFFLPIFDF